MSIFGFEGACEECGFDPSSVGATELPAAVRDVGRRYRVPLTRGLKGEDLDALVRAHPLEGVWSALSYACHTRDVLRVFRERTERMLGEDDPDLGWWDHDASVVEDRYDEDDPIEVADAIDLRSLTGGRGRFTSEHDHYDVLPTHLVEKVRREARDLEG